MTFTKSLMLGSAAALVAVAGASAADLPSKKAAPAQYVKICDAAGAGYFYIPGSTDTCIKIGGYAELDWVYRSTKSTIAGVAPTAAVAAVGTFPAIPATTGAPGTGAVTAAATRSNNSPSIDAEIQLDSITKTSYGDLHTAIGFEASPGDGSPSGNSSSGAYLDYAYLEWAGLTAGKHESFFHNIGGLYSGYETPDYKSNLLAYTASFGGGFSATVSLEDANPLSTNANGVRMPDVVGALRVKQGWGEASLIGGMHQTNYTLAGVNSSNTGYGVMGYVSVNLPMLAAGDSISFQAVYEKGAARFLGGYGGSYNGFQNTAPEIAFFGGVKAVTTGYAILGDFKHNWTPTVSTEIEGSYTSVKLGAGAQVAANSVGYGYTQLAIGQVTKWTPVKGLEFGLDTAYYSTKYKVAGTQPLFVAPAKTNNNDFRVQFRAIRSF